MEVIIVAKKIRLDKLLCHMGVASRRDLKGMIRAGLVAVDGERAWSGSDQVDVEKQQVTFRGEPVVYKEFVYLMLNKPAGYLSATEDGKGATVIDLIGPDYNFFELFPVGRLDKDTEGLLVLTNDGKMAHELLSPKKHVPKTYYADIAGTVTEADGERFKEGVFLDDYETMPADLTILESGAETSKILLTIYEGKYHQVKRMFEIVGKKVTYLKRLQMGQLKLDETLPLGEYRELTNTELEALRTK